MGVACVVMDPLLSKAAADALLEGGEPSRPLTADEITTVLDLRRTITFLRHQLSLILGSESVDDRLPLTCYRCGHRWRTVYEGRIPKACPRCHSMAWNRVGGVRSRAMLRKRTRKVAFAPKPTQDARDNATILDDVLTAAVRKSPPWTSFAPPPPIMGLPMPPTRPSPKPDNESEQLDSQVPPR